MTTIKVNRLALIKSLTQAKKELIADVEKRKAEWAKYDKEMEAWALKVLKQAKTAKPTKLQWGSGTYTGTITIEAPASLKQPTQPNSVRVYEKTFVDGKYNSLDGVTKEKVEKIDNTIKILELSTEVNVNASSYKEVAKFL